MTENQSPKPNAEARLAELSAEIEREFAILMDRAQQLQKQTRKLARLTAERNVALINLARITGGIPLEDGALKS